MTDLLSVIIPVFNGQAYLADTLRSVASQSVRDIEIIVVDDGSTDSTCEVVREFDDSRLRYIRQEKTGAAGARNRGVDLANGQLLAFLDADDVWVEDKLFLQIASLKRSDGEMIFAHGEEFISPDRLQGLEGLVKPHQGVHPFICSSTLLMRRELFHKVGRFDTRWRTGEFVDWYARAIDRGLKAYVLPQVLVRRRIHDTNTGRLERAHRGQYARVMKSVLDRRRAPH
jgi:glycosyltransferase involved in cell wall biosynthesis